MNTYFDVWMWASKANRTLAELQKACADFGLKTDGEFETLQSRIMVHATLSGPDNHTNWVFPPNPMIQVFK